MHAKGDVPLSDGRTPWRRSHRRGGSTEATVLLADGMIQPSRDSEHIDAVWATRTKMRYSCACEGFSSMSDRCPPWRRSPRRCHSTTATVLFVDRMVRLSRENDHTDAFRARCTMRTIPEVYLRQTKWRYETCLCAKHGEKAAPPADLHTKGYSPLRGRCPRLQLSPGG